MAFPADCVGFVIYAQKGHQGCIDAHHPFIIVNYPAAVIDGIEDLIELQAHDLCFDLKSVGPAHGILKLLVQFFIFIPELARIQRIDSIGGNLCEI